MLSQRVMNPVDARAAFGDHVLHGGLTSRILSMPSMSSKNAALERRADAHADAAFGDDRNFVLVGES